MLIAHTMEDFPVPNGLEEGNVGGDLFGQGERYYLTSDQRGLLDQQVSTESNDNNGASKKSIIDRFLDIFK